jgi:dolichyl-phosphate-mannose--protein O-mannosyl transferase
MNEGKHLKNGPAAAVILAEGIGSFGIGLAILLAEANAGISKAFRLYNPVGPRSGKVLVGLLIWLIAWLVFRRMRRGRDVNIRSVATWATLFLLVGMLFTLPPFFEIL